MILIATEGARTEPIYFSELKARHRDVVTVIVSKGREGQSNPQRVLDRLLEAIEKQATWTKRDQAWLAIDTDAWSTDERQSLINRIANDSRLHLAISNPCFELWLVLHFQDTWPGATCKDLEQRLRKRDALGAYSKNNYDVSTLIHLIDSAIERAERCDKTPEGHWPEPGQTQVYKLVSQITQL